MLMFVFTISSFRMSGATYYVSPTGSDTNSGATNSPWATLWHALPQLTAGDTLIQQPGIYVTNFYGNNDNVHEPDLTGSGTPSQPITIQGTPGAINCDMGITISGSNAIIVGMTFSNIWQGADAPATIIIGPKANHTFIHDCVIENQVINDSSYGIVWDIPHVTDDTNNIVYAGDCASSCMVSNVLFNRTRGVICIRVGGTNNLIVNNRILDSTNDDCFHFFGAWNTIRGNYCKNVNEVADYTYWTNIVSGVILTNSGQHPDMFQCFGQSASWAPVSSGNVWYETHDNVAENNQFWDCLMDFAQMVNGSLLVPGYTVRNFTERNNLFVRCGPPFGSMGSVGIPGFKAVNNTYVLCGTNQSVSGETINFQNHTTNDDYGYWGTASNGVVANCAFIGCGPNTNSGFVMFACTHGDSTNGWWGLTMISNYCVSWDGTNWSPKTTSIIEYVGDATDSDQWILPADINPGTDPKLVAFSYAAFAGDFRPLYGSPLIDAGTNASAYNTSDLEGTARPLGTGYDIGCFEFDPNLQVHLDFDENFVSAGKIADTTGYGHDAWNFNSTNWITATLGPDGNAGLWTVVGVMTNDPPQVYNLSQYAGITNLSNIQFITNGTISAWVLWATNTERYDTILDCGYPPMYAGNSSAATNSWELQYGEPYAMTGSLETNETSFGPCFIVYGNTVTNNLTNPSLCLHFNQPRDGSNWWHLAVVWNAASNTIVAYQNGQPISTNALGSPWLRVSGSPVTPWLSVGADQHNGTPQWGDDRYPNAGFLKGALDDIRIYNRALSSVEVGNTYFGSKSSGRPQPPYTTTWWLPVTFTPGAN
jgi:hypothetical protein